MPLHDEPGPTIEEWLAEDIAYLQAQAEQPAPTIGSALLDLTEATLTALLVGANTVLRWTHRALYWAARR